VLSFQGTTEPGEYPVNIYGTEVYELNTNLLEKVRRARFFVLVHGGEAELFHKKVLDITKDVQLASSNTSEVYRTRYDYAPANQPPVVTQCDVATSDVYYVR
jgi:purine nucleoside permease